MVLYKRKPVVFQYPSVLPDDMSTEVWYIPQTKEWFSEYEKYLERIDYYGRRKFVCEITGNSCLTFFEAHSSEIKEIEAVEWHFPEALREPVLRFLQFNTTSRLDQLVDEVYGKFKNDFYPGEVVFIKVQGAKQKGIVREKARFNAITLPNGEFRPAYCQYRVTRLGDSVEITANESQIFRDRANFTKWYVKTFIKLTVSRSSRVGAPWIVKDKFAQKYRIPTDYPPHLAQFKENVVVTPQAIKRRGGKDDKTSTSPAPTGKMAQSKKKTALKNLLDSSSPGPATGRGGLVAIQPASPHVGQAHLKGGITSGVDSRQVTPIPALAGKRKTEEDLSLTLELAKTRPIPHKVDSLHDSVSDALESWTFLNVYRNCFVLDTFTFDDFMFALSWDDVDQECELLNEIFCSVLSGVIGENNENLLISLPPTESYLSILDGESNGDGDEDEDGQSNGHVKKEESDNMQVDEEPEPEPEPPKPKKRGRKSKQEKLEAEEEIARLEELEAKEETPEIEYEHNVYDVIYYRSSSWKEKLRRRNFKDGNWQIILLGVLSLVDYVDSYSETIEKIFRVLSPLDMPATPATVLNQFYSALSIDLRIKALNIICELLVSGTLVRNHMDQCMEESTKIRRDRLENIREYKSLMEQGAIVNKELDELYNANLNGAAEAQSNNATPGPQDDETSKLLSKKRPRRALALSKEPTEQELSFSKINGDFSKLLTQRTSLLTRCEELRLAKKDLERQLNEIDCQRIRLIGRDRLYNRYWWFESNGLPTLSGGLNNDEDEEQEEEEDDDPDEVLDETYLNGRIWVQGPSEDDREVFLKLTNETLNQWYENTTPSQAKKEENDVELVDDLKNEDNDVIMDGSDEYGQQQGIQNLDFTKLPETFKTSTSELFGIKFEAHTIRSSPENKLLVDEYGATTSENLLPLQRKIIEEHPDPLLSTSDWRYFDSSQEIEDLIAWLNPWGKREFQLRKELISIKDRLMSSIEARRKALFIDRSPDEETELQRVLDETLISETEESSEGEDVEEIESSESEQEADTSLSSTRARTRRGRQQLEQEEEMRKLKEEKIREKIAKNKPSQRVAKREAKRRKIKEHEEKRELKETTSERLESLRENREKVRVLEWVNASATETLGHTHFEGPKKKPLKKNGRR